MMLLDELDQILQAVFNICYSGSILESGRGIQPDHQRVHNLVVLSAGGKSDVIISGVGPKSG
jgi:hypothetical protein